METIIIDPETIETIPGIRREGKPFKDPNMDHDFFGAQEVAYMEEGRWEGFVTLIKTEQQFNRVLNAWMELYCRAAKVTCWDCGSLIPFNKATRTSPDFHPEKLVYICQACQKRNEFCKR